ncbi:hypothetical protein [Leisingera caerulea]|uniref:hypothetical protein n=1 Tax=Leisingera caerulea TaxID=506591 RepID=UPI00048843D4|nr:hypothetical protein [Leisingera caerulea]
MSATGSPISQIPELPDDLSDTILLDGDDVVFDYIPTFGRWFERTYGVATLAPAPTGYNLEGFLPADYLHLVPELITEFNSCPEWFGHLPPTPGSVEFVRMAKAAGFRLRMLTACSTSAGVRSARTENAARIFGDDAFDEIIFFDLGASKLDELRKQPRSLWVDDLPKHVRSGYQAGHYGVVVTASHNRSQRDLREHQDLPWISSLADLVPALKARQPAGFSYSPA